MEILTTLRTLSLSLLVEGEARIEIFSQDALGLARSLGSFTASGEFSHAFDLDAEACRHALRLRFTVRGALREGSWRTADPLPPAKLAVLAAVRRPTGYLEKVLTDPLLEAEGVRLHIVEQSARPVLAPLAGPRCRVTAQRNLGGAGGIGRAFLEEWDGDATHFLTLDDDVEFDVDVILRALRAAQLARAPFVLGGIFLDPLQPHLISSAGSILHQNDRDFWQGYPLLHRLDAGKPDGLDVCTLPKTGQVPTWSFCLIPAAVVRQIGLPLPLFLSHDLDYGRRLAEAGHSVRMLPGVGTWQFYSLERRGAAPETLFLEQYNLLLHNARRGQAACTALFHNNVGRAMGHLLKHRHLGAASLIMGLEHFLAGWPHFRSRVLPGCLQPQRQELGLYPPEIQPQPHPALHAHLSGRLDRVLEVFQQHGREIQQLWEEKLPLTTDPKAWRAYAATGNLTILPE